MGDQEVRRMLYIAASRILRRDNPRWSGLRSWAVRLAKRIGLRKARIALARKLATVLFAMWREAKPFRWHQTKPTAS